MNFKFHCVLARNKMEKHQLYYCEINNEMKVYGTYEQRLNML